MPDTGQVTSTDRRYIELLTQSYEMERRRDGHMSRLEYLSDLIFDFTTYDAEISELFASNALEVCKAISAGRTFAYIKEPENYRWYLLMVNMPFFAGRLDWGTSVRGAWWAFEDQTLESCGLWRGDEQVLKMTFTQEEWPAFVAALIEFGGVL
jgi:hypothetical protein